MREHRLRRRRRRLLAVDAPWLGMGVLLTEPCYSVGVAPPTRMEHFPITSTLTLGMIRFDQP